MKKSRFYLLAEIKIEVVGNCEVANLICDELNPCQIDKNEDEVDLEINISDKNVINDTIGFTPLHYTLSGNVAFNKTCYSKKEKNYQYIVKDLFEISKPTKLNIFYNKTNRFKEVLENIIKSFIGTRGFVNKSISIKNDIMSYNLFWYIFPMMLLKKNKAFLHSSALNFNDEGIVFCGTSGCGKTSTTFKLLEGKDTKYLSEDFSIISSKGKIYFNPKAMSIYWSDVQHGAKDLVSFVDDKMGTFDSLLWNINKALKLNSIRKVSPSILLSEARIGKMAKLTKIYFISRSNIKNIEVRNISTNELVERSIEASFRELKILYEIIRNIRAVGYNDINFPSLVEIEERTRVVYEKAFENADKKIVFVPLKGSPELLLSEIGLVENVYA